MPSQPADTHRIAAVAFELQPQVVIARDGDARHAASVVDERLRLYGFDATLVVPPGRTDAAGFLNATRQTHQLGGDAR